MDSDIFPSDLKLQFIAQTLMSHYVDNNIDPLSDSTRTRPTIRTFQPRGRSRTPTYRRRNSQSNISSYPRRSYSNTSRISNPSTYEPCSICGGQHKTTTKGCPHLYRQIKVNEYIDQADRQTIERQMKDIDRHRSKSRSQSRDSRTSDRSYSSHNRR